MSPNDNASLETITKLGFTPHENHALGIDKDKSHYFNILVEDARLLNGAPEILLLHAPVILGQYEALKYQLENTNRMTNSGIVAFLNTRIKYYQQKAAELTQLYTEASK
jgi:hypothetical protein